MGTASLTSRTTQLQLLAQACARSAPARIVRRQPGASRRFSTTRLIGLRPDGVLLEAPQHDVVRDAPPGSAMKVFFKHRGERYAFSAHSRGLVPAETGSDPAVPLLRLSLPLRLEGRRRRQRFRLCLIEHGPVYARLTSMIKQDISFDARLTEISTAGFAGVVDRETARRHVARGPFWAKFELPGDSEPFEYVVRLAQRVCDPAHDCATVRWAYCGDDDATLIGRNLARTRCFVTQRARPVAAQPGGGR